MTFHARWVCVRIVGEVIGMVVTVYDPTELYRRWLSLLEKLLF